MHQLVLVAEHHRPGADQLRAGRPVLHLLREVLVGLQVGVPVALGGVVCCKMKGMLINVVLFVDKCAKLQKLVD